MRQYLKLSDQRFIFEIISQLILWENQHCSNKQFILAFNANNVISLKCTFSLNQILAHSDTGQLCVHGEFFSQLKGDFFKQ